MHDISDIKIIIKPIAIQYELKKVFLFGSYAKGNATPNSDIDLLIEKGKPLSLLKLAGLRQTFQDNLNLPVDLITTSGIDQDFLNEIHGTEVLLYEAYDFECFKMILKHLKISLYSEMLPVCAFYKLENCVK